MDGICHAEILGCQGVAARPLGPRGRLVWLPSDVPPPADTVCGISYGAVGGNIAYLPKLEDVVEYLGATATFSFYVNTTGSVSARAGLHALAASRCPPSRPPAAPAAR